MGRGGWPRDRRWKLLARNGNFGGETQPRFCRREQSALRVRGAFHAGIARQFHLLKTCLLQQGQESLSRQGPTDSLIPVVDEVSPLRGEGGHQHHVSQVQAAAGLENPENFLSSLFLIDDQVKGAV